LFFFLIKEEFGCLKDQNFKGKRGKSDFGIEEISEFEENRDFRKYLTEKIPKFCHKNHKKPLNK